MKMGVSLKGVGRRRQNQGEFADRRDRVVPVDVVTASSKASATGNGGCAKGSGRRINMNGSCPCWLKMKNKMSNENGEMGACRCDRMFGIGTKWSITPPARCY